MPCLMGAKSREARDRLPQRQVVKCESGLLHQIRKALRCSIHAFLVLDVLRRRSDDRIPVDSRGDEYSLSELSRNLEHGVLHIPSGPPVKQDVISPSRGDMDLVGGNHVVQDIRIDASGVDHSARPYGSVRGLDNPVLLIALIFCRSHALHLRVEPEFNAVGIRVLGKCDGRPKGAHDSGGRRIERGNRDMPHAGLELFQPLPADNLKALDTVFDSVLFQGLQFGNVLFAERQHKGAVILVFKIELFRELRIHPAALQIVLRHKRPVRRVKSRVDNRGIRLGSTRTDILRALHDTEPALVL